MDCVILAAGENTRLRGLVAPYHKPLIAVGGETLIGRLVSQALTVCQRVSVVVSPKNVVPISDILDVLTGSTTSEVTLVVQPRPTSSLDALRLGIRPLSLGRANTLLLCADNYIPSVDWERFLTVARHNPATGVVCGFKTCDEYEARRFARLDPLCMGRLVSGEITYNETWPDQQLHCWCGPLTFNAQATLEKTDKCLASSLVINDKNVEPVFMGCGTVDVGIPEVLSTICFGEDF